MTKELPAVVLPLDSPEASLARVGGKGQALAILARAGLPVPDGFLITTDAYRRFEAQHALRAGILDTLARARPDPAALETISAELRALFEAPLPTELAAAIRAAWEALDAPAVAVRSSATAEDLPELSFAGQQDTYLNVRGATELLEAVRRCWASLWTARAIGYRARMGIDHAAVAMGVVVQRMVNAEVAGILFTANPSTGARSELVVNASYGLGEAVVGGEVTPDTFVVERTTLATRERHVGAKALEIVAAESQGTVTRAVTPARRDAPSLTDATLTELGELALAAERLFGGTPQDIEWAVADGRCWLLQSRPITQLPQEPLADVSWELAPGVKLVRRQVVENMPDPLSPLFEDLYLHGLDRAVDEMFAELGIPLDISAVVDRPMFITVNGYAYCRAHYRFGWPLLRALPGMLWWYVTKVVGILKTLVPRWQEQGLPTYLAVIARWRAVDTRSASDTELLAGIRELALADARHWWSLALVVAAAKITDAALNLFLTSRWVPGELTSGVFLRGFPSRTREAQDALAAIARAIVADPELATRMADTSVDGLTDVLEPTPHWAALERYVADYGHQIYTLDFVEPTQAEDPQALLATLKSMIERNDYDDAVRQAAMAEERDAREREMNMRLGPVRRWWFRKLLGWAQRFGPYREDGLFHLGAAWPTLRRLARELGARLVRTGTLTERDQVFYLDGAELDRTVATARAEPELGVLARERQALREARMRLHPPGFLPEGETMRVGFIQLTAFETQKRNAADARTLSGFAVSPGRVTGPVSRILRPAEFAEMRAGTILVCPTTTAAWTPLFAKATGLVTDIGGILAHGSIVAREYGIPAVLGTGSGTRRIETGQRIIVDGDAGTVTLLDAPAEA